MATSTVSDDEVWHFIKGWLSHCSYPPTVREIADGLKLKSTSSVHAHLRQLQRDGRIKFQAHQSRTIRLIQPEKA